jgi:hypothetical protein
MIHWRRAGAVGRGSIVLPFHSCLPNVLAELLQQQPLSPAKVAFAWRTAVGPSLARATTAALGSAGELVVLASDHHWQREIQRSVDLIAARLDCLLGPDVVARIVVKVGGPHRQPAAPRSQPPPRSRPKR